MKTRKVTLDTLSELLSLIYDAVLDVTIWPVFLERITKLHHARSGLLRIQKIDKDKTVLLSASYNYDHSWEERYKSYYANVDPALPYLKRQPAGTIHFSQDISPENELARTEFYNDYLKPQDIAHIIAGYLIKNGNTIAYFGLQRSRNIGPFLQRDSRLFTALLPHIQRAVSISQHICQMRQNLTAAQHVLDRFAMGIFLVDESARVINMNNLAQYLVDHDPGVKMCAGKIQLEHADSTRRLHDMIKAAIDYPSQAGSSMMATRACGLAPHSIMVAPLNSEKTRELFGQSHARVIVFIGPTKTCADFPKQMLRGVYQLTKSESRLTIALCQGMTIKEIARKYCVTEHTLRSQIKSIYQKTGVRRQADLIKLVLTDPASIVYS